LENNITSEIECYREKFPEKEFEYCIENHSESIPALLRILEKVIENPEEFSEDEDFMGVINASFLLAQLREERAYPFICDILRLEEEQLDNLLGDYLSEDMHRVIASISGGDPSKIKELIEDEAIEYTVRNVGLRALVVLVMENALSRESVVEYFKTLYNSWEKVPKLEWTALVECTNAIHPKEFIEEIRKAYEDELVNEFEISFEEIEEQYNSEISEALVRGKMDPKMRYIDNAVKELKN
jgi:hypothetical protein